MKTKKNSLNNAILDRVFAFSHNKTIDVIIFCKKTFNRMKCKQKQLFIIKMHYVIRDERLQLLSYGPYVIRNQIFRCVP